MGLLKAFLIFGTHIQMNSKTKIKKNQFLNSVGYGLKSCFFLLMFLFFALSIIHAEEKVFLESSDSHLEVPKNAINKRHILYLMHRKEFEKSINLYQQYASSLEHHDFEILQELGSLILEQGARSNDPEKQILSIYGSGIAGISSAISILEAGINSSNPQTQIAAIQFLGALQEDRSDELLNKAMSSVFLLTRIEAAYQLAARKTASATGQVESLMYKLPPMLRYVFPEFFALIGTSEAIGVLKHLIDDPYHEVRVEAILSASRYQRDDLLPLIRSSATHANLAEQEACAAAFGFLKDSKSIHLLKKWSISSSDNVKLAALKSLYMIGEIPAKGEIINYAREKNLFAINALGQISGSEEVLAELLADENIQVRVNSAISLLKLRDPRCLQIIVDLLIRDTRDLGFQPQFTIGRSLVAWKVVPSVEQHMRDSLFDLRAITISFREQTLADCLELPEKDFLKIASLIFESKQTDLTPKLVRLLENLQTPQAIQLLKRYAQLTGAPLIRAYCNLALFRLKEEGPYAEILYDWIAKRKTTDLFQFRQPIPKNPLSPDTNFELSFEESSSILIDSYLALAERHDKRGIDTLLAALKGGNSKNRFLIAGLLIRSLQ